ncbi:MAG: NgoPII family restriction endonuclease [Candidatus Bathyarchaeota archaeon]|nr:NgoPII family restriction endonuclease [Candidatus Bathyarchaeum tardum]WNZ28429.1 MAG: NgoPII family restriction endonuclease [Candidatus Bathyarchaeota archaeon]
MCPNLLTAIKNISDFKTNDLRNYFTTYAIRINAVGQQLEYYVKDAISGSFQSAKEQTDRDRYKGIFSYLGNQNNPPDLIIKNGDAFEVKKIQSFKASLALNNSPPKDRLSCKDPRITNQCRQVDGGQWNCKEIFYVIGWVQKEKIKYLYFVQGSCYAAEKEIYERQATGLKNNIENYFGAEGLESTRTKELGRINRIDPLGITNFRIRGMWEIQNPVNVFSYLYTYNKNRDFSLVALMLKSKFDSFPEEDVKSLLADDQIEVSDVEIKNPNNPAELVSGKLITLSW